MANSTSGCGMTPKKTVAAAASSAGPTMYQRRPASGSTGSASGEAPAIAGRRRPARASRSGRIHIAATTRR